MSFSEANERQLDRRSGVRRFRFSILLVVMVGLLAVSPIISGFGVSAPWFDGLLHVLMVAAIVSLCFERRQRLFAIATGVPTVVLSLGGHAYSGAGSSMILLGGQICEVVFLFGSAGLIVRSLFHTSSMSFDSILGAVCGYLFLGLGWAVVCLMIEHYSPGSFQISPALVESGEPSRVLPHVLTYYSFVTLTTVGFGDVSPISPATRTLAWIEAISGQFYLAVIVAGIVSMMVANTRPDPAVPDRM